LAILADAGLVGAIISTVGGGRGTDLAGAVKKSGIAILTVFFQI